MERKKIKNDIIEYGLKKNKLPKKYFVNIEAYSFRIQINPYQ